MKFIEQFPTRIYQDEINFSGWTGHVSTSWKLPQTTDSKLNHRSNQDICYDGTEHVLYWADACSEIAFIVPSHLKTKLTGDQPSFNANILSCKY